jgi:hypothetical protein
MATDIHFHCKKQKSFAWAKYYDSIYNRMRDATIILNIAPITLNNQGEVTPKELLPSHITQEFYDMAVELKKTFSCPVCLELVNKDNIQITFCGHIYCNDCLTTLKNMPKSKCAVCRKSF